MNVVKKLCLSLGLLLVLSFFFSKSAWAGFYRDLENGLKADYPSGYQKAPQAYKVGETVEVRVRLFNTGNRNISDNYWLEVWKVEKCELSTGTITVTGETENLNENQLDQCSGGTLERVARTQKRWWWQDKRAITVNAGSSYILSSEWVINEPGYYQFDFFSDSTWKYGPFATGFFRAQSPASPTPSPTPKVSPLPSTPSPTPISSVSPVPMASVQPSSGGEFWIFGGLFFLVIFSGGSMIYLLTKKKRLLKSRKRRRKPSSRLVGLGPKKQRRKRTKK